MYMNTHICSIVEVRKNQYQVVYLCDQCREVVSQRISHFERQQKHFCSNNCYWEWRKEAGPEHQPTWRGGVSQTETHRRWKAKNPERMAHLKARRYARERGADGSHTFEEWQMLQEIFDHRCVHCGERKPLTKDHVTPLSKGGSDYIGNIQPLCRNCNSRKWNYSSNVHQHPELLQ